MEGATVATRKTAYDVPTTTHTKGSKSVAEEIIDVTRAVTDSKQWALGEAAIADGNNASTVASTIDLKPSGVQRSLAPSQLTGYTEPSLSRASSVVFNTTKRSRTPSLCISGTARKIMRTCEGRLKQSSDVYKQRASIVGESMAKVHLKLDPQHITINFNRNMFKSLTDVRQVDRKFIIGRFGGTLLAIDQHAAGERVGLERLMSSAGILETQPTTGTLLVLKPTDASLLHAREAELEEHGWRFAIIGARAVVTGVPKIRIGTLTASPYDLLPWANELPFPAKLHYMYSTTACHQAVKFGDSMSPSEVSALVSSLGICELPFQCAHGRPTVYPICSVPDSNNRPFPDPLLSMLVMDPLLL